MRGQPIVYRCFDNSDCAPRERCFRGQCKRKRRPKITGRGFGIGKMTQSNDRHFFLNVLKKKSSVEVWFERLGRGLVEVLDRQNDSKPQSMYNGKDIFKHF